MSEYWVVGEVALGCRSIRRACSWANTSGVVPLAGPCWTTLSRHHTVIAHHSSLLGHPLGLDVQKLHPVSGLKALGWAMSRTIVERAWTRSRRARDPGSDCRRRCGVIHSATTLQLARRIQLSTLLPCAGGGVPAGRLPASHAKHTLSLGVGLIGDALATIGHVSKHGPRSIACVQV